MSKDFLIECGEDLSKELTFDKFMDEILVTENSRRMTDDKQDQQNRVRLIIKESTERPSGRTKYRRK